MLRRISARDPALLNRAAQEAAYRPIRGPHPYGSSLPNIQSQYHSSDDSSVSPSPPPPESRGRTTSRSGKSRRQPRPTPSPTRPASINTRSRTQRHHAPARFPGRQTTPNISDWTVASLQKALRDKSIPFHRTDNKAKLFKILTTAGCTNSSGNNESSSADVITQRRDVTAPVKGRGTAGTHISAAKIKPARTARPRQHPQGPSTSSQMADHYFQQPTHPIAGDTMAPAPPAAYLQQFQQPIAAASGTGMPAPPAALWQQLQQQITAAPSTGMPAPPAAPLQHLQQPIAAASGTGMTAPPAAPWQQLQQPIAAALGNGMPAPPAALWQQWQQPITAASGTGMPVPPAALWQQLQQQIAAASGTGMPAHPPAPWQQLLQLIAAASGTGMPAPPAAPLAAYTAADRRGGMPAPPVCHHQSRHSPHQTCWQRVMAIKSRHHQRL